MLQAKCEQYWPENIGGTVEFDGISIFLTKCDVLADCTVRTMVVSKVSHLKYYIFVEF